MKIGVTKMNDFHILHVDDERDIREYVGFYLKRKGFSFYEAENAHIAIEKIDKVNPHLILLDVRLPDKDGFELCKEIREKTNIPILFLSGKDTAIDRILGLNVGGDDYICKPFHMDELIARIMVQVRRHKERNKMNKTHERLVSPSIELNKKTFECIVNGDNITLTMREFELLYLFMSHPFQVFSAEQLIELLWGLDTDIDTKAVLMHIGNVRKKLQDCSRNPRYIITIRGIGYKFNEHVQKL